eukprot:TRINITY_DN4211_c0_g1_i1.p1 TRINITY_DN4211_c0_g1~~TRINITY_DN4211_c0_g1_i1.p1  ORF type:complete len:237 (-),score=73.01 TRINITY_DN4211_c0_g1_i1:52-762(-)
MMASGGGDASGQGQWRRYRRVVRSSRLVGVVAGPLHAPRLAALFNDRSTARFMDDPEKLCSEVEVASWYEHPELDAGSVSLAFHLLPSGAVGNVAAESQPPQEEMVGFGAIYDWKKEDGEAEISFALDPRHRGSGLGREIVGALCSLLLLGRDEQGSPYFPGVERAVANVVLANVPSHKAMEAWGFSTVGAREEQHVVDGVSYPQVDLLCTKVAYVHRDIAQFVVDAETLEHSVGK